MVVAALIVTAKDRSNVFARWHQYAPPHLIHGSLDPFKSVLQMASQLAMTNTHTHIHTRLTALCLGLPRWAGTRKVNPILLEQETVSGSGISWAICKSAPRSRQITTPAPHYSSFLQTGYPSCHPTNSVKYWRHTYTHIHKPPNVKICAGIARI